MRTAPSGLHTWLFPCHWGCHQAIQEQCSCREPCTAKAKSDLNHTPCVLWKDESIACLCFCVFSIILLPAKPSSACDMKSSFFSGLQRMLWEYQQASAGMEETQGKVKAGYYCSSSKSKKYTAIAPKRIRWIKGQTNAHMHLTETPSTENIKTKPNFIAFKPLFTFRDSFDILSVLKTWSLRKGSGFILNKIPFLNWNMLFLGVKKRKTQSWIKNKGNCAGTVFDLAKDFPTCTVISCDAEQETELSGNHWSFLGNTEYRKRPTYASAFAYFLLVCCSVNLQVNKEPFLLKKLFWDTFTEADGI